MEPLGIAVVGAGYWGPNLVRNFGSAPGWRLRWLCDLDVARARTVLGEHATARATADLAEALADPAVDAVAVATPADTHLAVAMAALEAGKHVLVEKPLASTRADGLKLVEEAERRGLVLMCDHTYCYTPAATAIRDLVHSGELGDIHFVDSVRINLGLVQRDINVLWDLAPHDLSILDFILPDGVRPISVSATGADPIGAGQACVAYLTLRLSGGAIAHSHVNWLSPTKVRTTMVGGSKRTLLWDDLNPAQRISVFDRGVDLDAPRGARPGPAARRPGLLPLRRHGRPGPARARGAAGGRRGVRIRDPPGPRAADRRPRGPAGPGHPPGRLAQPGRERIGRHCGRKRREPMNDLSTNPAASRGARIEGARALVTGGAGTIGSHVVDALLREGAAEVLVLDNFVRGRMANLRGRGRRRRQPPDGRRGRHPRHRAAARPDAGHGPGLPPGGHPHHAVRRGAPPGQRGPGRRDVQRPGGGGRGQREEGRGLVLGLGLRPGR